MSAVQDYLGNLMAERSKMVEKAAASNDLIANIKGIAQLQLAIIAVSTVAAEKNAAHHFDAAMSDFKMTHGVA
ncbi:hypothetical protein ACUTJJ_11705 [Agrobacterium sp. DKPNP3]|uniref:hypothetical protein n=1 Tax=Agrobacterium sp. DKPNP3 TaxID=3457323 RepID=UPI004044B5B8